VEVVDVLIVGGGPAGSSCAWRLSRAGLDVTIWDRHTFPRDKVCAGWITPQVVAALEIDLDEYVLQNRTLQPIKGFRLSRLGDAEARVVYDRAVSFGIRRCEFDNYLLRRSGARLQLGEPVARLVRMGGEWVINDSLRTRMLVGAGGHFCPVARHLGACVGNAEPIVAAQETEFEMSASQRQSCQVEPDVPELFFARDLKGYGWVFRKGNYINIGLGRQDTHKLGERAADFLAFLRAREKIPAGVQMKLRGHPYLLYDQAPRPLSAAGALLIGDAAGLAYPKSGEGIRPAIESGLIAADAIIAAAGRYDPSRLALYERQITHRFGPREPGWGITDLLPGWAAAALAGRLFGTPWFARRVVLDRWFFHRHETALGSTQRQHETAPLSPVARECGDHPPQSCP
jgi:geranylgeranyl reductase family protein